MKAPFSAYLARIAPGLKELIALLRQRYDYVSVLSTDSVGFSVSISQRAKSVSRETIATERGTAVRVYRDGLYAESAFTGFDPAEAERILNEGLKQYPGNDIILNNLLSVIPVPERADEVISICLALVEGTRMDDVDDR